MNILILISSLTVLCLKEVLVSTLGMREGLELLIQSFTCNTVVLELRYFVLFLAELL